MLRQIINQENETGPIRPAPSERLRPVPPELPVPAELPVAEVLGSELSVSGNRGERVTSPDSELKTGLEHREDDESTKVAAELARIEVKHAEATAMDRQAFAALTDELETARSEATIARQKLEATLAKMDTLRARIELVERSHYGDLAPIFSEGGDLCDYIEFLGTLKDRAKGPGAILECRIHEYSAALINSRWAIEKDDRTLYPSAERTLGDALRNIGIGLYHFLEAVGYGTGQIDAAAQKWADAINPELAGLSLGSIKQIRVAFVGDLTDKSWMTFERGQMVDSVESWAVFDGDRVVHAARVGTV